MVIANAEHYIVANGVLFRLIQQKKVFDTSVKCLLVIPEKYENTIFHMFHDTLLGAHYGPVNTYYTIKDRYWIHTCLKNYKGIYLRVMHANNKNRKEVRFHILTQGFLSGTIL